MKLLIRIDDVGWTNPAMPDRGLKEFSQIHSMFKEYDIPYYPCIIPMACDSDMREWIEDNIQYPCLHGYYHYPVARPDDEYAFDKRESIMWKFKDTFKKFKGVNFYGFSAPFNRYNDLLVDVCEKVGLKYFLAGYGREKKEVYQQKGGIQIIPCQNDLYVRSDFKIEQFKRTLKELPERQEPQVITLHATWEILNLRMGNNRVKPILEELKLYEDRISWIR